MPEFNRVALSRFLLLYGTLYAGFGVQSPYLPSLLDARGLRPEAIALVLATGTAVRLAAGPTAGRLADRLDAAKPILALCCAAAALIGLAYLPAAGLWPLLAVGTLHSATLAPLAPLADALALGTAAPARPTDRGKRHFEYGWVRAAGSAAFILGVILSGQAIGQLGIAAVVWLNAGLLAAGCGAGLRVPKLLPRDLPARPATNRPGLRGVAELVRLPLYRRVVLVVALILGSHAMHDSFAMILWSAAGAGPGGSSLMWSLSVAAEVLVFLILGRPLLDRLGTAGAAVLAAAAGIVRWAVMAETAWLPALAAVEPLHGLTFALLHLTCMRLLAASVPPRLAATALTIYGTIGIGAPTALLTLGSGVLYARVGAHGFWIMAALCAAALPIARTLRADRSAASGRPQPLVDGG